MPRSVLLALILAFTACRSPLRDLRPPEGRPLALAVPPVAVEDHSRSLKRLQTMGPGDSNTPESRKHALEGHANYLDGAFRTRAARQGLRLDPDSPYRLELTITSLGEVRTRYIGYGIASGVAWGIGTGLATHNPQLALGLGAYELAEESLFWIAGSSLFGRYSAPVVVEARLLERGRPKPLWEETYYAIWGGKRLKDFPEPDRTRREIQLHASLERVLDKVFEDLALLPGTAPAVGPDPAQGPPTASGRTNPWHRESPGRTGTVAPQDSPGPPELQSLTGISR